MEPKPKPILLLPLAILMSLGQFGDAAELVDSSTIVGSSGGSANNREIAAALNGLTGNGGLGPDGSIFVTPGGDPRDPADYRMDVTASGNNNFGAPICWQGEDATRVTADNVWGMIDLGEDVLLDSLNIFNYSVTAGTGNHVERGTAQADIYYMADGGDPTGGVAGQNSDENGLPFVVSEGWIAAGTPGEQTFMIGVEDATDMLADKVDMSGITARYIAFDVNSNHGGTARFAGFGEIQVFKFTEASTDDPVLGFDSGTAYFDYDFGDLPSSATRTLTYINNSLGGAATINIDSVQITDDGSGTFSPSPTPIVVYDPGNTGTPPLLNPGDKVSISVTAMNSTTGTFVGSLSIDTTVGGTGVTVDDDFNDKTLALEADSYANGERLNPNPLIDLDLSDWSGNSVHVTPGIGAGSTGMARVPGEGDPDGGTTLPPNPNPSSLFQTEVIPDGAGDFEVSALFTPADASNFAAYVDPDEANGVTGASGAFSDRSFQWVLLGSDADAPDADFGDTQADNTIINLAYMPDGVQEAVGVADFYTYDDTTGEWEGLGIGAIQGSLDNDTDGDPLNGFGDGKLDPSVDPLDVVNVYRLLVRGSGFGTESASYDVTVSKISGPDTFTTGSAAGISSFHGMSGIDSKPTGHAFISSDSSISSNFGDNGLPGYTTPFWVDDTGYFNASAPTRSLTVLSNPELITLESPETTGSTSFMIRNDGTSANLEVSSIDLTDSSGFSITSPAGAFSVAPGAIQQIDIAWDSTAASESFEAGTLTLNSDDPTSPQSSLPVDAGVAESFTNVVPNWNFETPGTDPITDSDTFDAWEELVSEQALAENIIDVPGLVEGSPTAAFLRGVSDGGSTLNGEITPTLSNFTVECDFAISESTSRRIQVVIGAAGTDNAEVNIRYQSGNFDANTSDQGWIQVLNMTENGGELESSIDVNGDGNLDDEGDTKISYKLKLTCSGWGTSAPFNVIEVMDSAGNSIATSEPFSHFRFAAPTDGASKADLVRFSGGFGSSSSFWVDDVIISGQALETEPDVPVEPSLFQISGFEPGTEAGSFNVTFGPSSADLIYSIEASNDLGTLDPWVEIDTIIGTADVTTSSFQDAGAAGQESRTYRVVEPE